MKFNPEGYSKTCPMCGTKFIGRTWVREFCSEECRRQAYLERHREENRRDRERRRYKKLFENPQAGIMPPLKKMTPDELLRYGKYQQEQYIKRGRGE